MFQVRADTYELDLREFDDTTDTYKPHYQGIAGLTGYKYTFGSGTSLTLDGKIISAYTLGSGTFCSGVIDLNGGLPVMVHEFGHYLFGGVHYEGVGYHGLMDGSGSGVMSSFERNQLGWLSFTPVTTNLSNETITDALTTNDVYKIQAPDGSYFLVDNHQRQNFYESSWTRYNGGPLVSPGTGLLISHCTSYSVDIESAFGRWDWKKEGGLYVYPFEVDVSNRNFGEDKLDLRNRNTTQGRKSHPDCLGSSQDYFNIGYNQLFSPWSNPGTYPDAGNIAVELAQNVGGVIYANFYLSNAVSLSPSKPQNLHRITNVDNHPTLAWDLNTEPDILTYKIYRSYDNSPFYVVGTVSHPTNTFVDYEIDFTKPIWEKPVKYYVVAVDNTNKSSIPSDQVSTKGITNIIPKNSSDNFTKGDKVIDEYMLSSNYPNPFNPSTVIKYSLPYQSEVEISIYDIMGKKVKVLTSQVQPAGYQSVIWDGTNEYGELVSSGVYIYRFRAVSLEGDGKSFEKSSKLMLVK